MKKTVALFFLILLSIAQAASPKQRLVYAWQEYTGKDDDDSVVGYVYAKTGDETPKMLVKNAIYPRISSDGRELIYSQRVGGDYVITVKDLSTGKVRAWSPAGFNLMSSFSGNGRYIAYSGNVGPESMGRDGRMGKENRIVVIDRWANGATETIPSQTKAYFPKLSSDGRYVVFHESFGAVKGATKKAATKRIAIYDRHAKTSTYLTPEDGYCFEPALSHDDRYVAAVCRSGEGEAANDDIYVYDRMNADAAPARLTQQPGLDYAPTFTGDGSVIFSSDSGQREQEFRLFIARRQADGTYAAPALLIDGPGVHYVASVSGDLNVIARDGAPLARARSSFGVAQAGKDIVVLGGNQGKQHDHSANAILTSAEILHKGAWRAYPQLDRPTATQGFELFYHDRKLFAVGGKIPDEQAREGGVTSLDAVDVFDLEQKRWVDSIRLASPRSSYAASQIGSKVYLLYGWSAGAWMNGDYVRQGEVLDLATGKSETFDLPEPYRRGFATAVWRDKVVLVGGFDDKKPMANVDLFDPKTRATTPLPSLPFGSFSPTATVVGDTLYAFGGVFMYGKTLHTGALYVNHVYRLDLAHPEAGWVHTGRYMRESRAFLRAWPEAKRPERVHLIGGHGFKIAQESSYPVTTDEVWEIR